MDGSQWDAMMNILIDGGQYVDKSAFRFSDEISAVDLMNQTPEMR